MKKFWNRLAKRERYALMVCAAFVVLFVVVQFAVTPFLDWRNRLRRTLAAQSAALAEMREMETKYAARKSRAEAFARQFARRPRDFSLFSFLDELAGGAGIKNHIAYMKPSKSQEPDSPYTVSKVELKLEGINLKQLTPYLHRVEMENADKMVFVRRMSITRKGDKGVIDVILQVETYET
ncbi:MAG: type II secretion system protein GspM [Desulfococcaceae bacterium]